MILNKHANTYGDWTVGGVITVKKVSKTLSMVNDLKLQKMVFFHL